MPPLDLGGLAPNSEVLVAPVHLAGPGTREAVFSVLDNAAGWTKTVAFGTDTYYTSPCQRVRIANPVESHYGGWTITYAEDPLGVPDWITTFDRNTPHEIAAAFTETLVHSLPNHFRDYLGGGRHHTGLGPEDVLLRSDWEPMHGSRPYWIVSAGQPHGHAHAQRVARRVHRAADAGEVHVAPVRRNRPRPRAELEGLLQWQHPAAPAYRCRRSSHQPRCRAAFRRRGTRTPPRPGARTPRQADSSPSGPGGPGPPAVRRPRARTRGGGRNPVGTTRHPRSFPPSALTAAAHTRRSRMPARTPDGDVYVTPCTSPAPPPSATRRCNHSSTTVSRCRATSWQLYGIRLVKVRAWLCQPVTLPTPG